MQKRRYLFRQAPRKEGNRLSGLRDFRSNTNGQNIEILQDVSGRKEEKGEKMKDTITVDFSRKELKSNCKLNCPVYKGCKRTDRELIKCLLVVSVDYKIKGVK